MCGDQRPVRATDGSNLLLSLRPSLLYGAAVLGDFTKCQLTALEVTVIGTAPFFAGDEMILATISVYGSSGQVIDPSTELSSGTFRRRSTSTHLT